MRRGIRLTCLRRQNVLHGRFEIERHRSGHKKPSRDRLLEMGAVRVLRDQTSEKIPNQAMITMLRKKIAYNATRFMM